MFLHPLKGIYARPAFSKGERERRQVHMEKKEELESACLLGGDCGFGRIENLVIMGQAFPMSLPNCFTKTKIQKLFGTRPCWVGKKKMKAEKFKKT